MSGTLNSPTRPARESRQGFLVRVREWFEPRRKYLDVSRSADCGAVEPTSSEAVHEAASAQLLPFPVKAGALLASLASVLRGRCERTGPDGYPLLLTISHEPRLRLTVDPAAYVEIQNERGPTFLVVIEVSRDTTLSIETSDLEIAVRFLAHYIGEKR